MVSGLVSATRPSAVASNNKSSVNASLTVSAPVTSGRSRVRSTWPSRFRSARSLAIHPAARITTMPAKKMASSRRLGKPSLASTIPHSVGAASRKVPIGLSKRIILRAACHLDGAPRSEVFNEVDGSLKGMHS